jgi:hypothetical protein
MIPAVPFTVVTPRARIRSPSLSANLDQATSSKLVSTKFLVADFSNFDGYEEKCVVCQE